MQLWGAILLFIVCMVCAVILSKLYRKSKKTLYIVLSGIMSLLSLAFLAYVILTLTFINGIDDTHEKAVIGLKIYAIIIPFKI